MYKSQLKQMYPYDWFCGPGSHIISSSWYIAKDLIDLQAIITSSHI